MKVYLVDTSGLDWRQRRRLRRRLGRLMDRAISLIGQDIIHGGKSWRVHDLVNGSALILHVTDDDRIRQAYLPWYELGAAPIACDTP